MLRLLVLALLISVGPSLGYAEEVVEGNSAVKNKTILVTPELIQANIDYELAKMQLQQYRLVTLPEQRRSLDEQIRLTHAELQVLQRRLIDYKPFLEVDEYSPVRNAAENHYLAILATKSHLRSLRDARINQMRYTRQNYQLLRLNVLKAATKIAMLKNSLTLN